MDWSEGREILNRCRSGFEGVAGRRNDCFTDVIAATFDFSSSGSDLIRWRFVIDGELIEGTDIIEIEKMFSGLVKKNSKNTSLKGKKYCIWTYNTHLIYWNLKEIMDKYCFEIFEYNNTYRIYELSNDMFKIYDYGIRKDGDNADVWEIYNWAKEELGEFVFPNRIPKTPANNLKYAIQKRIDNIAFVKCNHYGWNIKKREWQCLDWTDKHIVDVFAAAYQGGFISFNEEYRDIEIEDADVWDMCSAYPAVVCHSKLPIRFKVFKGRKDQFEYFSSGKTIYATMGVYKFYGLKIKQGLPPYISSSWIIESKDVVEFENMPKVKEAGELVIAAYDLTYQDICEYYTFDKVDILEMYIGECIDVDDRIKEFVLECFDNKEKYRNKDKKLYKSAKEYLNSVYGVMGQRLVYDKEYRNPCFTGNNSLFYYPWGGYISAIQRHTMADLVKVIGKDFIYSNTDSVVIKSAASDIIRKWNIDKYGAAGEDDIYTIFKIKMLDLFKCTEDDIKEGYDIIMQSLPTTGCERTIEIFKRNLNKIREDYPIVESKGLGKFKLEDKCKVFRFQRFNRYYYYNQNAEIVIKFSGVEDFAEKDMIILPNTDIVKVKDNIKVLFDGEPVVVLDYYSEYRKDNGFAIIHKDKVFYGGEAYDFQFKN